MAIRYHELERRSGLTGRRKLSTYLLACFQRCRPAIRELEVDYIFCSDVYLLEKNIQFLNHHTLTDIITFDLSEKPDSLRAEIYISIERVRENARLFTCPYREELHRVIFHGMLHLCGLKDKSPKEQREMRVAEQKCLDEYFRGTLKKDR